MFLKYKYKTPDSKTNAHLVTHLVWSYQENKPTREAQGLADQSMKKPILSFLTYLIHFWRRWGW